LRNLIEFREREWKVRGIQVRSLLAEDSITVMGSHGQLEQVFLNLLVHAEQSLCDSSERLITIRTSLIARRILVEIGYSGLRAGTDPLAKWSEDSAGALGLGVCRSIVAGHGGDMRVVQTAAADPAFHIELPCAPREKPAAAAADNNRDGAHPLTALVIEPGEATQTRLRTLLTTRGYRVVPVTSSDEGLDLAQRMRFDAVFCSVDAPGLNWVETAEHLETRVGSFVLVADAYNAELAADCEDQGRFVLARPVDEKQLDQVLETIR